ncbi:uncharacterized [Tachysurus ichikawai]
MKVLWDNLPSPDVSLVLGMTSKPWRGPELWRRGTHGCASYGSRWCLLCARYGGVHPHLNISSSLHPPPPQGAAAPFRGREGLTSERQTEGSTGTFHHLYCKLRIDCSKYKSTPA